MTTSRSTSRAAWLVPAGGLAAATVAGAGVVRRRATHGGSGSPSGWRAVTVLAPPEEVLAQARASDRLGADEDVEVQVRPAPGDRGTELRARLRPQDGGSSTARDQELRTGLQQVKALVEVGALLTTDPRPHGHRRRTPLGAGLDAVTRRASGGVL